MFTVPSLALVGLLIPVTGLTRDTVLVMLVLYALVPIVRNTIAGLRSVDGAVLAALEGVKVTRHEKEPGEPTAREADAVAAAIAESRADVLVAIGGGSVIDVAKAARLARSARLPYLTVQDDLKLAAGASVLPFVAVPTTAGSGSPGTVGPMTGGAW